MKLKHYLHLFCIAALVLTLSCSASSSFLKKSGSVIRNPSSENENSSSNVAVTEQEMVKSQESDQTTYLKRIKRQFQMIN